MWPLVEGERPVYGVFGVVASIAAIASGLWFGVRACLRCWIWLNTDQGTVQFHTRRRDVLPFLFARLGVATADERVGTGQAGD